MSTPDFVYFVDQHQGVLGTDAFQSLDDFPGESTSNSVSREIELRNGIHIPNVCSPMSLDLCDIRQTTNREAEELPVKCTSNRFANGRLANTRRSSEANNLALNGATQFAYGQKLENTILDILQAIVVLVEDLLSMSDRIILLRVLSPWDLMMTELLASGSGETKSHAPV